MVELREIERRSQAGEGVRAKNSVVISGSEDAVERMVDVIRRR
jgi:hypothetical protein